MALYFLALKSKAYPDITNRIRGSVKTWDGATTVVTIIDSTTGHPARLWNYPGLPRANYQWVLEEINGSGVAIRTLSDFMVVPSTIDGLLTRDKEQLQVDAPNSGLVSGTSSATLDGTGGVPDFRGWKIVIAEYGDIRNILVEDLDYTWDITTGQLEILQGEQFQHLAWWTFLFTAQTQTQGNSSPIINDYSTRLLTETSAILYEDFGNAILIKQAGVYGEYSLPDITTIPVGRPLEVEIGLSGILASKFLTYGSDIISFLRGNLVAYPGESFTIVRYQNPDLSNEWRVKYASGNFARCGDIVGANQIQSGMLLAKLANGDSVSKYAYARIFNDIVLNLPSTQRCAYADHNVGNNKYLFSAEGTGGSSGLFYFPDYRGLTLKGNNTGKAGDFEDWMMVDHKHEETVGLVPSSIFGRGTVSRLSGDYNGTNNHLCDLTSSPRNTDGSDMANIGSEIKVKSVLTNTYILI
jgi:hypothetical protein